MKKLLYIFLFFSNAAYSQQKDTILLTNFTVQLEVIEAIDSMYNFNHPIAEKQFTWLKQQYPDHPLPYFLLALNEWWKILPNEHNTEHDEAFLNYINLSISKAKARYKINKKNPETTFFLSASYGFKARLFAERNKLSKAAVFAKKALNYLLENKEANPDLQPEYLFGVALYNYYREWIPDHKKFIGPIMMMFPKGSKEEGIKQLEDVASQAFYTRVEAMRYLVKMYYSSSYENKPQQAWDYIEYLHKLYPNNAYFHRQYLKVAYRTHRVTKCKEASLLALNKIEQQQTGYEAETGRIASFYLGYYAHAQKDTVYAQKQFSECLRYTEQTKTYSTHYTCTGLQIMAKYAIAQNNPKEAYFHYQKIIELSANKKRAYYKEAKKYIKQHKKEFKD
ncbi:tol-pal system protein YbgF [Cyclobacteriaceae bacterium]|nr:tol-pal system protein YbgF [Cyclobacteriaceae bacterium]